MYISLPYLFPHQRFLHILLDKEVHYYIIKYKSYTCMYMYIYVSMHSYKLN